jgi:Fe-S oxidoreductase
MCPSYQATREEQHSTRGRANALRLAMTGQLGLTGLTDPTMLGVLDLCLECKACKSECPTNVDMARLKAEFLHHYYRKHGLPWRNWVLGHVDRVCALGRWSPRIFNAWMRSRLGPWLTEKLLRIDCRRLPPLLAEADFETHWFEQEKTRADQSEPPSVMLFPDTFTNHYEPEVGLAAIRVLHRLGRRALLGLTRSIGQPIKSWPQDLRCCGRPAISTGLLAQAVDKARHNVERLYPWVAATSKPIIACEPSCLLTIKDDYPALLRGDLRRKAEAVAAACQTFEEFVGAQLGTKAESSTPLLRKGPHRIVVQDHCHQRALVGMNPILGLLRCIPGAEVIDLDAGCCGMAGSFGYEKEHYEISRLVGEQRLFPALRQADADTVVVAPGFSCRMQIQHFTGRTAVHPAQLLDSLLV